MKRSIVFMVSVLICIFAYLYNPKMCRSLVHKVFNSLKGYADGGDVGGPKLRVLTREELSRYKGENGGKVCLAIVGDVYDVSRGRKHYGPGGGYSFFSGIDGSAAFVTGEFTAEGLVDDISNLSNQEILGLENWKSFYAKDYKYIGKVEGAFYDKEGRELDMMRLYKKKLEAAMLEKDLIENDRHLFPPCNSEWSQDSGGRVWCSPKSGGVSRDWIGVPRMYYAVGSSKPRCACIRTSGPPSHDIESNSHKNRGDLGNPNLSLYPQCSEYSDSCPLPKT